MSQRVLRWSLVTVAVVGLAAGVLAHVAGQPEVARLSWTLATIPVIAALGISIIQDFLAGRLGVDAIAFLSMTAALVLGEPLTGAVVALMYSGSAHCGRWSSNACAPGTNFARYQFCLIS